MFCFVTEAFIHAVPHGGLIVSPAPVAEAPCETGPVFPLPPLPQFPPAPVVSFVEKVVNVPAPVIETGIIFRLTV